MTRRRLVYLDGARLDLLDIVSAIAEASGSRGVASRFVAKLRQRCRTLADLPGIVGTLRPELGPDLRSTPHGNYLIFFRYVESRIEIVNVVYAGRDLERLFEVAAD
ncbi:type II toxin-antitoxin system RelE/ParE family toxin [Glacieibacterium frigidum]|uniref:Type II toxin-antitoxin system RelE/ParE family toxin n=1 Tax=Glacieibacterium frigidum TaxID=2593303 RepID=A0A552UJ24_9SPHN|nr:type II toxin-antitoxin system RelE/ParE family toxin [Glacieibacterium frigidum]TRW18180.1 type II toxin-antitoxin system RelE/ParE family toxin [Glacieibacterium frigidum]